MWLILLTAELLAVPSIETAQSFTQITAEVRTGTLIFSQGDCLAVRVFSGSPYTHVGMVVVADGSAVVYDAMPGAGVRKSPLEEYLHFLVPSDVELVHPGPDISGESSAKVFAHLERELGRPYSVRHHLTGRKAEGVHCAEYMTEALIAGGRLSAANPARVSPGSLRAGVLTGGLYQQGSRFDFTIAPPPPAPEDERWYQWCWRETSECCSGTCGQLSRWFLCKAK